MARQLLPAQRGVGQAATLTGRAQTTLEAASVRPLERLVAVPQQRRQAPSTTHSSAPAWRQSCLRSSPALLRRPPTGLLGRRSAGEDHRADDLCRLLSCQ